MSERDWLPGMTISMDPDAVLDYEMDFTLWLEGETLASVQVLYENCTAALQGGIAGNIATYRVSAVVAGAKVTLRATSSTGQIDDFTVNYRPVQR